MMKTLLLLLLILNNSYVFADGMHGAGNGGRVECAEFVDLAVATMNEINLLNPQTRRSINPSIDVEHLTRIAQTLRCIPAVTAEDIALLDGRHARSSNANGQFVTHLGVAYWRRGSIDATQKVRLVLHELAVLAGIDGEDDYRSSQFLVQMKARYRIQQAPRCSYYVAPIVPESVRDEGRANREQGLRRAVRYMRAKNYQRVFDYNAPRTHRLQVRYEWNPAHNHIRDVQLIDEITGLTIYEGDEVNIPRCR